jgi:hypothetical protein
MATENRIERTIGPVVLAVLAIGCVLVLRPFFTAVCFALILVIATWPALVHDTTWSTLVGTWRRGRLGLYVDGFSRASSTEAATNTSALFGICRWGWGFSTPQATSR